MTTIEAASADRASLAATTSLAATSRVRHGGHGRRGHGHRKAWKSPRGLLAAASCAVLGMALAGCETGSNLLGQAGPSGPQTELASPAPSASSMRLALVPVIGPSEEVARQMQASLGAALAKQNIAVTQSVADKSDYTLRGYVVAAREKTGVKLSHMWDVTDPTGQRVNRITGEEMIPSSGSRDPWQAVSPQVIEKITSSTASQLAAWAPGRSSAPPAASTPVAAAQPATSSRTAAAPQAVPSTATTTGSIDRSGNVSAYVPNVSGAPGDGRISLTSAIQRELSKSGVALASNATGPNYKVEGVVDVGQAKDGKQPIKIDWHVKDPAGKKVGTVSQKNEIAAGSLDGPWGTTAEAAAAAAAQGILKLLEQKN